MSLERHFSRICASLRVSWERFGSVGFFVCRYASLVRKRASLTLKWWRFCGLPARKNATISTNERLRREKRRERISPAEVGQRILSFGRFINTYISLVPFVMIYLLT